MVKDGGDGEEMALASLRPGDEFGEQALLDGGTRNATVRCSTDVEVLRLDRKDFLPLLAQYPELKISFDLTALQHEAVRDLKEQFPEFRKLTEERLALYRADTEARFPLDFAEGVAPGRDARAGEDRDRPGRRTLRG